MKVCTKCGVEKPLEEFGLHPLGVGGRQAWCRQCCNQKAREKYVLIDGESRRARTRAAQRQLAKDHPRHTAFRVQARQAKHRGIRFLLTFEEWVAWWGDNLQLRGRGPDGLCMCRYGDEGPYRVGNIYMASGSENSSGSRPLPEPNF